MAKISSATIANISFINLVLNGSNLVSGIIAARLLQPVGRGELATVLLWPAILASLGIMGTNFAFTREVANCPDKEADLARSAVILSLSLALVTGVIGFFSIKWLLPSDKCHLLGLSRIYLLWLPLNFLGLNLIALDHGRMRWRQFNLKRLLLGLLYLLFLLVFWVARIDRVGAFVIALILSNLFTIILCVCSQWQGITRGRTKVGELMSLLRQGLPFFLAAGSGIIAQQLDKALVVTLLSTAMVGCYAAAFSFASAHAALGIALGMTSFAAMANESDPHLQGQYMAMVFRQATLLYLGAGVGVALLAPLLIVPLFGLDFTPAVRPAAILALATSLLALGNTLNEGLHGRGSTYPGIIAQLLGGGGLALMAWQLTPHYGIVGLAWAVVVGALGQLMVLVISAAFLFGLNLSQLWGLRLEELRILCLRIYSILPFRTMFLKTLSIR